MDLVDFGLPAVVLLPFIAAGFVAYVAKYYRLASAWGAGFITICSIVILSTYTNLVFEGVTTIQSWSWIESIGLDFAFRLDGLGLIFSYLILFIGLLIIIYARYYISDKDSMGRFYSYLLLFMGSMLGIVLSENILLLVVFWELTTLSSFLLISYWQHTAEGRDGAKIALTVTGAGGLFMLGGMILLGHIVGSYNLSDILASADLIKNHEYYTPIILLILLGVFTKSAQFPFHFWLPRAMSAPTPVSAYLHSATMVKAGIFLLARMFPVLSGTTEWIFLVSTAGLTTLLFGSFIAIFKDDLKGLLAYSTIGHLGLITLLFGFSTPLATVAAIFHIINHATFKASLFMVTGIIDHETGTRDMKKLSGLWVLMPHTATLAMVAAAAMAGVPLLNGFLSKEMFFDNVLLADITHIGFIVPTLATLAGIFAVAYSIRFIHAVFFNGKTQKLPKEPHDPPKFMTIPVDILVVICVAVGIFPMITVAPILATAVVGTLQTPPPVYSLAVWHGFSVAFMMSIVAFIGGIYMYYRREPLFAWYEKYLSQVDAKIIFDALLDAIFRFSEFITTRFDKSSQQNTLAWFISASIFAAIAGSFYGDSSLFGDREFLALDWISLTIGIILIVAAIATVAFHHKRFIALISVGVIGLVVSLIFAKFSAPDLALTQLSVEVVTIILILLALYYLPQTTPKESSKNRLIRDITISAMSGVGIFIFTLSILSREYSPISDYFLENSLLGGGGSNVVNVILVDFRGFDTLGEITVLAIAGLGIFSVLQGLKLFAPKVNQDGLKWSKDMHPPMMQTLTRLMLPLMLLVAVYIFLRGHNLPGGGFIAGLIGSVALIVQYLANGIEWTRQRLKFQKNTLISLGLFIATFTGTVSMFLGYPFLTTAFTHLNWPIVGEFEVASAVVFDIGVFLVVVGTTVLILVQLGKLSQSSHESSKSLKMEGES